MGAGRYGALERNFNIRKPQYTFNNLTMGEVVDTNDPQQMGRIRVWCPTLGDNENTPLGNIPWASYISPLGGVDRVSARGRTDDYDGISVGHVAYGMWNIPNVGSTVLVACIDGDTGFRVYLGCLYGQYLNHTMPHGRYLAGSNGPRTSQEEPIYPLFASQELAFGEQWDSPEYASRGADGQISGLDNVIVDSADSNMSKVADDKDGGYTRSRHDPNLPTETTDVNRDSQRYAWTTPGFHAISMDDNANNCRVRIRTTHGSQIILDDSNERIYIQSAEGETWVELDEKGNIDVYATETLSLRSRGDVNITADKTVRIAGKEGVHLSSNAGIRMSSATMDLKASGYINIESTSATLSLKSVETVSIESTSANIENFALVGDFIVNAMNATMLATAAASVIGVSATLSGSGSVAILSPAGSMSGGVFKGTDFQTPSVGLAGHKHEYTTPQHSGGPGDTAAGAGGGGPSASPSAPSPGSSGAGTALAAYFSNRVPEHEPWARMYLDLDQSDNDSNTLVFPADGNFVSVSEYSITGDQVGKGSEQRGITFTRNVNWRR